ASQCDENQFRCPDTQCINAGNVCDGECDCLSCADEDNCGNCTPDEFTCHNGQCVQLSSRCDVSRDCNDWSDEIHC
ncbi:unnamed protein product, partial [Candidula unifasciata]